MKVILAFAAIYIIWGSTYFAVLVAIKDFPHFLLSAIRFLLAGTILFSWCLYSKEQMPSRRDIAKNSFCGILMLVGGLAFVAWAQQYISSGLASIFVTTPFWFVLLDKRQWKFYFSNKWIIAGLITGFIGVALLLGLKNSGPGARNEKMQLLSFVVLIAGSILWATGSLLLKYRPTRLSTSTNVSIQLFAAGLFCGLLSFLLGETKIFSITAVHFNAWLSLLYLTVMSSIIAYLAYVWLIQVKPPAIVGTYAYVNPVIAILLGWGFAGETISTIQLLAAGIILCGVLFVNIPKYKSVNA